MIEQAERERLSDTLNDTVGQILVGARLMVEGVLNSPELPEHPRASLNEVNSAITRAVAELRSFSRLLQQPGDRNTD